MVIYDPVNLLWRDLMQSFQRIQVNHFHGEDVIYYFVNIFEAILRSQRDGFPFFVEKLNQLVCLVAHRFAILSRYIYLIFSGP